MPDPGHIPAWALDKEAAYPCPCGEDMDEDVVVVQGEKGLLRLFHPECVREYLDLNEDS